MKKWTKKAEETQEATVQTAEETGVPQKSKGRRIANTIITVGSGENAETVARRYLTNGTAAPYTVLSMGQLTMSDDFCTVDTPICWEWVYDLLGYYVRLEPTNDGSVLTFAVTLESPS